MAIQTWRNLATAIALSVAGAGLVSAQPAPAPKAAISFWPGEKEFRPAVLSGADVRRYYLKTLAGGTIIMDCRADATGLDLKQALSIQLMLPVAMIRVINFGKDLADGDVVAVANPEGEHMHLVLHVVGG